MLVVSHDPSAPNPLHTLHAEAWTKADITVSSPAAFTYKIKIFLIRLVLLGAGDPDAAGWRSNGSFLSTPFPGGSPGNSSSLQHLPLVLVPVVSHPSPASGTVPSVWSQLPRTSHQPSRSYQPQSLFPVVSQPY